MKRIWSFLLALSLVLALPAAGFAADGATVGTSTVIVGVAEGGTLPCSKSVNWPEQQGFSWDMDSEKEPVSASYTLFGEQMEVRILNLVNENGLWLSGIRTYGMEKHTFSKEDIGKVFSGSLTVNWKDGSSSVWKLEMTVTDDPNPNAVEKPYLVHGRKLDGAGSATKYAGDRVWEWTKTINRDGTSGFPFTLFSDQEPKAVKVTLGGKELQVNEEDKLETDDGEFRSVYWTGVRDNYTKEDLGKTFDGEVSVTWADNSTSAFLIQMEVVSRPAYDLYIADRNGNLVDDYRLQLGETYTARIRITDQMNVLGQTYAGQKLTAKWAAESGYDRITLPADSHVPHDENGVPEAFSYGDDPASYTIPEDTTSLGQLPFGVRFTAKAAGDFDIRFELSIDGRTLWNHGAGNRIVGERPIIEEGKIEESFEKAEGDAVVIPVETGKGLNSGSFEKIFQLAEENKAKTVSLKVTGATLTIDISKLDLESAQYQNFLKDLEERNGGVYDPSVNLNIPSEAKNRGYTGGRWMDFSHSGTLPAPITVTVDVPEDVAGGDGSKLCLWYYNSVTGRADDTGTTVTVQSGKASFAIDHCSAYALYPIGYDPNPKASATGASGSSGGIADLDWADARSELKAAKEGETVRLSLPTGERVPASLLRALAAKEDVTLVLQQGGKTLRIHSGDIGTLTKAEYRFSELQSLFGEVEGESGKPAAAGEKANPGTGAPVCMKLPFTQLARQKPASADNRRRR